MQVSPKYQIDYGGLTEYSGDAATAVPFSRFEGSFLEEGLFFGGWGKRKPVEGQVNDPMPASSGKSWGRLEPKEASHALDGQQRERDLNPKLPVTLNAGVLPLHYPSKIKKPR